ncbi:MAG: galactokinase [Planctomycetaceae bacterium]|nr:galactokinase [Planctomycetales bacterium]MCB9924105.1 galactokinase [Planctomycetaceae bacterium]
MSEDATASSPSCLSLAELCAEVESQFQERFGQAPQWIVAAPGRVNLIGEHTDYNGGFVLPAAIDRYVVIAASPSDEETARLVGADVGEEVVLHVRGSMEPGQVTWASYLQGVVAGFAARGCYASGFNALVRSTVPLGSGLSSSAALEVATATLLEAMLECELDPVEKALLCQQAEHKFAGVPCGIMDQFSSVLCQQDTLMLLDCRSQSVELVPLDDTDVTILIANSNVKHELTGGEYARRRAECEAAAKMLGVRSLRDATFDQVEVVRTALGSTYGRRVRHVISEIARTLDTVAAIRDSRWQDVGRLMYASHESLRDDYEVSCDELNLLVDIAQQLGETEGVFGSRMTGGGFGGCTVSLVKTSSTDSVAASIIERYFQRTGIQPTLFTTRPARGAHRIK